MGYSNGQVQKQSEGGKGEKGEKGDPGPPGIGFNLTDDGNFDIDSKRLTDLAEPVDNSDAATKNYVSTKAEKTDVILRDGTQSMKANLDMQNDKVKNKIINLANGTDNDDAVNLAQLKSYTDKYQNNYHLRESFSFYRNYGDKGELIMQKFNIPNHNHHNSFVAGKEGFSPGFGSGWAWVSLRMTNNLPAGTYTAIFEIFSAVGSSPTNITFLNRESLIQAPVGDNNYKIITFSHDYQTTHSKAFVQFTSNGQPGEITFQLRFYGSEYRNPFLGFLFNSVVASGKIGTAFNHRIFDVDQVQLKDQILYFDDIQMNSNKIKGLGIPTEDNDASNKKYVDDEIAKIPHSDNGTLKLDGSRAMTGDLKMGDHTITGIRSSSADNAALTVGASKSLYLPISGNRGMQGNINMGKNFITNLKDPLPNNSNYAASVNFVNRTVSDNNATMTTNYQKYVDDRLKHSVQSSDNSNSFQYVMDNPAGQLTDEDDIKGIKKTDKDFHKINKETYEMQLLLD